MYLRHLVVRSLANETYSLGQEHMDSTQSVIVHHLGTRVPLANLFKMVFDHFILDHKSQLPMVFREHLAESKSQIKSQGLNLDSDSTWTQTQLGLRLNLDSDSTWTQTQLGPIAITYGSTRPMTPLVYDFFFFQGSYINSSTNYAKANDCQLSMALIIEHASAKIGFQGAGV